MTSPIVVPLFYFYPKTVIIMATIKVKFRPSTIADREGTIYYQIIHERKVRQLLSDYRVFPTEWDESRSMVTSRPGNVRKFSFSQFGNASAGTLSD